MKTGNLGPLFGKSVSVRLQFKLCDLALKVDLRVHEAPSQPA